MKVLYNCLFSQATMFKICNVLVILSLSVLLIECQRRDDCELDDYIEADSCDSFLRCVQGRLFRKYIRFSCPPGTVYNPGNGICVHGSKERCNSDDESEDDSDDDSDDDSTTAPFSVAPPSPTTAPFPVPPPQPTGAPFPVPPLQPTSAPFSAPPPPPTDVSLPVRPPASTTTPFAFPAPPPTASPSHSVSLPTRIPQEVDTEVFVLPPGIPPQDGQPSGPVTDDGRECNQYEIDATGDYAECTSVGLVPSFSDCSTFYRCIRTMGCILKGFYVRCPNDYLFDDVTLQCLPANITGPCNLAQDTTDNSPVITPTIQLTSKNVIEFFETKVYWKFIEFIPPLNGDSLANKGQPSDRQRGINLFGGFKSNPNVLINRVSASTDQIENSAIINLAEAPGLPEVSQNRSGRLQNIIGLDHISSENNQLGRNGVRNIDNESPLFNRTFTSQNNGFIFNQIRTISDNRRGILDQRLNENGTPFDIISSNINNFDKNHNESIAGTEIRRMPDEQNEINLVALLNGLFESTGDDFIPNQQQETLSLSSRDANLNAQNIGNTPLQSSSLDNGDSRGSNAILNSHDTDAFGNNNVIRNRGSLLNSEREDIVSEIGRIGKSDILDIPLDISIDFRNTNAQDIETELNMFNSDGETIRKDSEELASNRRKLSNKDAEMAENTENRDASVNVGAPGGNSFFPPMPAEFSRSSRQIVLVAG